VVAVLLLFTVTSLAQTPPTGGGGTGGGTGGSTGGTGGTGGVGGTGGTGTRPPGGTQPTVRQPDFGQQEDPFSRGRSGVQGRIVPNPGQRLMVELYLDGMRMDMTFSDLEGNFKFERQPANRRYEIRIQVGPDMEFVEEIDFNIGFPVTVHIRPTQIRSTRPDSKAAGTIISLASLNVPKNARKEFDKGKSLSDKKKYQESLPHLQKAVELYPKYAEAFNEMGIIHKRQNQVEEAEGMFRKAIEADPKWVHSYLNLAQVQLTKNKFPDLLETTNKVLALNSRLAPALFYSAIAHANLNDLDAAEKAALSADEIEFDRVPQTNWLLGRIYEVRGQYGKAIQRYKKYLREFPQASNAADVKASLKKLEEGPTVEVQKN
jgi:predicted Zn-dependent protease